MEKLFAVLSSPPRLWVLGYLAANGPTRQVDLLRAFTESDLNFGQPVNPGVMSQIVRSLQEAKLIGRTGRARGPLELRYDEQTRRLLSTASALSVAVASDALASTDQSHATLMRNLTAEVPGEQAQSDG